MTTDAVEICRAFSHAMDAGDTETLDRVIAPNFVWHHLAPRPGRDSEAGFVYGAAPMFKKNYHYFQHRIIQLHGHGDWAVMHTEGVGKRVGTPDDAPDDCTPALKIIRLENGKIAEIWALPDLVGFLINHGELNLSPKGLALVGIR